MNPGSDNISATEVIKKVLKDNTRVLPKNFVKRKGGRRVQGERKTRLRGDFRHCGHRTPRGSGRTFIVTPGTTADPPKQF